MRACVYVVDHIAVKLYLSGCFGGLTLHYPCSWDNKKIQFHDTGTSSWKTNPGRSANRYHHQFTKKLSTSSTSSTSSLLELQEAHRRGAIVHTHNGFYDRNKVVANVQYLIAFTWAVSTQTITGGTKHTWNMSSSTKVHVSLPEFHTESITTTNKRKSNSQYTKRKRFKQTTF